MRNTIAALVLLLTGSPGLQAADFSASLSYTTDYTVLGLSRSRGEGAWQGGLNLEMANGFYASLWASQVEYAYQPLGSYDLYRDERDLELDFYLGYRYELRPGWHADVALTRYTYPGATATSDWNYTEALFALHYRDRLSLAFGASRNLFAQGRSSRTLDADVRLFTWRGWLASAGAGYVNSDIWDTGYWHGRLQVARRFGPAQAGVIWHTTDDTARELFGPLRTGPRLEVRLDVGF